MKSQTSQIAKTETEMSVVRKLLWGMFWGVVIGGSWMAADFIRPLIYGA